MAAPSSPLSYLNTAQSFLNNLNNDQGTSVSGASPDPDIGGDKSVKSASGDTSRWYQKHVRSKILQPSLTSQFLVHVIEPSPQNSPDWTKAKADNGIFTGANNLEQEKLMLLCSETVLPGSTFASHEITSDRTGVTEKHVYRRQFDQSIDLTFMVNAGKDAYLPIRFFETWMKFMGAESSLEGNGIQDPNYAYRMRYPKEYYGGLTITKFERSKDAEIKYGFVNAYPLSVISMPVSYDSSQIMKCTVSFLSLIHI